MSITGEFKAGDKIFKDYISKGYLGEGGFGKVYLVENSIGLPFALKVLHKDVELEKRGVESVMRIQSNRLIKIIDYGETVTGDACILMEYVKGNLADKIAGRQPVEEEKACHYFEEILKGLQVLEENGVVHRDIKPANLFILEDIVKIGDFGLSRYTSGESSVMTSGLGTIEYAAPESFEEHYSYSADQWAAAMVFFQLVTGWTVFQGKSQREIFKKIIMDEPDLSGAPAHYRDFLEKCFRKKPEKRHVDIEEMLSAFSTCTNGNKGAGQEVKTDAPAEPEPVKPSVDPALKEKETAKAASGGDGTITDEATGLMWQQAGSDNSMKLADAKKYIDTLNEEKFAGYTGWRLPTINELASLLEPENSSIRLYIDPVFNAKQGWCWTADNRSSGYFVSPWRIGFLRGQVSWYLDYNLYVRAVRS